MSVCGNERRAAGGSDAASQLTTPCGVEMWHSLGSGPGTLGDLGAELLAELRPFSAPATLGACAALGLSPVGMVNSKKGGGGHLPIPNTMGQPYPRRKYSKSVVRARGNEESTGGR